MILGIDPGLSGALAWITTEGGFIDALGVASRKKRQGSAALIHDEAVMWRQLNAHGKPTLVVLEETGARDYPHKGTCHKMGLSEGTWRGLLAAAGFPWTQVRPSVWKPKMLGRGAEAGVAAVKAGRRWPEVAKTVAVKSHDGIADALWLAEFGRQFVYTPGASS